MQLSLDWVSDFVDVSDIDPKNLAELLTERVAEVEHVHTTGCSIPLVVVGEILKIEPIEGADKIQLATVDVGSEKLQIVCGAKNIHEGAKVPVALVDCILPGDFKIEKRKLKGVESCGMICSEAELGLAEKSDGIMLLDSIVEIGKSFSEVCGSSTQPSSRQVGFRRANAVFEIDNHAITHRADLFSQFGFAREIAVLFGKKLKERELAVPKIEQKIDVEVAEPKLCPRYSALKISGIEVKPSSRKIRDRLESCGVRSINNIVDATNYVMLEQGQPLHAFDSKKLKGGWILVRRAKEGEQLVSLDGETRELDETMLVIADAESPVALAGVMGGKDSEVSDTTTEIILEAANFDSVVIRKTSVKLGLRSESSLRFEKRLDPELPPKAIARFLEILRETNPEIRIEASTDVKNFTSEKRILLLSLENLNQKLGLKIPAEKAIEVLRQLGFKVEKENELNLKIEVPSFRAGRDIEREIDLIEEVIRHLGYKDLPAEFPTIRMTSPSRDFSRELKNKIEDVMVGFGFHETATLAMVSEKLLKNSSQNLEQAVKIQNPPSEDFRFLRNSLLASLLEAAALNSKNEKEFRLFEISTIFENSIEKNRLAGLIVGETSSFLKIRGVLEKLLESLHFLTEFSEAVEIPSLAHPGRAAEIKISGKKIGVTAQLHPAVAKNFELPESAFFCLDFEKLSVASRAVICAKDLPRFPGVPRDLAILVSQKTLVREVENAIFSADSKIQNLKLFDIYTGKGVPESMKSLAFSLEIRDENKTLEEEEAEEVLQKVVENLEKIGGKLRS